MNAHERHLQKERREGDGKPTPPLQEQQARVHSLKEVEEREARRRSVSLDDADQLRAEEAALQSATSSTTNAAK